MPPDPAAAPRRGAPAMRLGLGLGRLTGGIDAATTAERLRLAVYTIGLSVAFGLYLLVEGPGRGPVFWIAGLGVAAGLGIGLVARGATLGRPFGWAAAGAAGLALAVPLAPALLGGEPLAAIVAATPLWPEILVTLFASRVLAELCDQRFAAFWQAPLQPHAPARMQSNAAAVALGACLTLLFYQAAAFVAPEHSSATTLTAIVARALTGETAIHRAIVFLFFVILAFLCDAGLHHRRDREALAALRAELAAASSRPRLRALLAGPLAPFGHTRTVRLLADAATGRDGTAERRAGEAFDAFHAASRRFVRGLLPFLPLLGFFGTVVGLATAMAALPTGSGESGRIDLSGSLSGLALKFETTLLGILASMIASLVLASLEKGETELAAECALLAGAADPGDAG